MEKIKIKKGKTPSNRPFLGFYITENKDYIGSLHLLEICDGYNTFIKDKLNNGLECFYIDNLWIEPKYRKKGYCKKLLEFLLENTKGKTLFLNVVKTDEIPLKIYKMVGFDIVYTGDYTYIMKLNN